jgi:hypothetical protein
VLLLARMAVQVLTALGILCCSSHQLLKVDPKRSTFLACGLLLRGDVVVSDVQRSIARIKKEIHMVHWNEDGFKVGLCSVPSISQARARAVLLCASPFTVAYPAAVLTSGHKQQLQFPVSAAVREPRL